MPVGAAIGGPPRRAIAAASTICAAVATIAVTGDGGADGADSATRRAASSAFASQTPLRTTKVLKRALDEAARRALADGISTDKYGVPIRDVLARKIVFMAKQGERTSGA
jgi:hypothetical protein